MSSNLRKRQIRFTLILAILIAICLGVGIFMRFRRQSNPAAAQAVGMQNTVQVTASRGDASATVYTSLSANSKSQARLVFCNVGDTQQTAAELIQALTGAGLTPVFYISDADARRNAQGISAVVSAGYDVGLYYAASTGGSSQTLQDELAQYTAALTEVTNRRVKSMLVSGTVPSALPAAAGQNNINMIYALSRTLSVKALASTEQSKLMISALDSGEIILLDASDASSADISAMAKAIDTAKRELGYAQTVPQMIELNNGAQADAAIRVYTSEPAVAFTFSGLGDEEELTGVLNALKELGATALFYVTSDELNTCSAQVRTILANGHDLGIAVQPGVFTTASAQLSDLFGTREILQEQFGYTKTLPVRQSYGSANAVLREAASAGGFTLLSGMLDAVQTKNVRETDASVVLENVIPVDGAHLQRGQIVHFQMKMFQYSKTVLGELVKLMASERTTYAVRSVVDIIENTQYTYTYPVPEASVISEVKNKIGPGHLAGKDVFEEIKNHYIGIGWVSTRNFLPGFLTKEIRQLDTSGLLKNEENMVFLTFDDWGTDKNINKLLDVLKKHNARGTFFVRTEHVANNPNLLRAIAMDGHTIASHTRTHYPLSTDTTGKGTFFKELTEEELVTLREDLVMSFQDMVNVIGDVKVNGRPALSLLFRPPTLAVGRNSLETVLDYGFTYSISGNYTTADYKSRSAERLSQNMIRNTRSGAILIMHMSDNSIYTAEALDLYLTYMEENNKPYRFVSLGEVIQ